MQPIATSSKQCSGESLSGATSISDGIFYGLKETSYYLLFFKVCKGKVIVVEGRDAPLVLGGRDLLEQRVGQERQVGQVDASQDVVVPEVQNMSISRVFFASPWSWVVCLQPFAFPFPIGNIFPPYD